MSKKQDDYYFDNFIKCAEYACKEAYLLKEILTDFQPAEISKRMEEVHEIEREADTHRHEITDKLAKAFITPIEREDIIALSHHIDDVTDKIEEVLIRVYINNVQEMREEVFSMLNVVIECCEELQKRPPTVHLAPCRACCPRSAAAPPTSCTGIRPKSTPRTGPDGSTMPTNRRRP